MSTPSARAWSDYVGISGATGMHAILVRPQVGLELDRKRVAVSIFDDYALRIAERCIAQRASAIIGHPDPLNALPALVPSAAHIYRAIETSSGSDLQVAVVTRDWRMRSIYRRLRIGPESLSAVVPAYAVGSDGVLGKLGTGSSRAATYFARSFADLRSIRALDLIVVDAPAADRDRLAPGTPRIHLVRDPSSYEVMLLARALPAFCWSVDDVVSNPEFSTFDGPQLRETFERLENIGVGAPPHIETVVAPTVADNASLFWADIGSFLNATRDSDVGVHLARSAFELYRELLSLTVPLAAYERHYGSISSRIHAIEHSSNWLRGSSRDLYVPTVALELRELASALGAEPPKERALRRLLEPLLAFGTVTIITRDRRATEMLKEWLAGQPRFASRAAVIPFSGLASAPTTDSALFLGMAPTWARHVYFCGIAKNVEILAYSAGARPCVTGFSEAELVARTLQHQQRYARWLARPAAKARCWEVLSGEQLRISDEEPAAPMVAIDSVAQAVQFAPDTPPSLWSDLGQVVDVETSDEDDLPPLRLIDRGDGTTHAKRLTFAGGSWALVEHDGEVTIFDRVSRNILTIPTTDVRVGMVLVSIDNRTKKDVLAKVLEVSSDIPALAIAAAWMHPWRTAIGETRRRFGTLSALHRALAKEGCSVQYQTVRLWIVGGTIGPDDPENIRRLGIVTEQPQLTNNFANVHRAMETFRSAHSKMGRRVGELAMLYGAAAVAGRVDADEVLDERSGLTTADLRDCIRLFTIEEIDDAGSVPTVLIDRVNTERKSGS